MGRGIYVKKNAFGIMELSGSGQYLAASRCGRISQIAGFRPGPPASEPSASPADVTGGETLRAGGRCPGRPDLSLFGFAEGYLDATDGLGDQVVDHRAYRAHRGYQDDVQRAEHAGVAQDPGRGEPSRDVRAR
jgi:hypothetical protein